VQQRALAAALQEGGKELQGRKVVRKYGLSASTMSRALASLQAREILRPEERLGSVRLRLVDPFFGAWMKLITGI
jgi:DNA-binding IclR family transcriptional regulator